MVHWGKPFRSVGIATLGHRQFRCVRGHAQVVSVYRFRTLGVAAAVLVLAGWAAPTGAAAAGPQSSGLLPAAEIVVGPLWTEPAIIGQDAPENSAHVAHLVCFSLSATGMQWDWLHLELRAYRTDGSPLMVHCENAKQSAGSTCPNAGADSLVPLRIATRVPMLRPFVIENRLCAPVLPEMLPDSCPLPGRIIVQLAGAGRRAAALCQAELSFETAQRTAPLRSLRVLAIDLLRNTTGSSEGPAAKPTKEPSQPTTRGPKSSAPLGNLPNVARGNADGTAGMSVPSGRKAAARSEPRSGSAFLVQVYVEAVGLGNRPLSGRLAVGPASELGMLSIIGNEKTAPLCGKASTDTGPAASKLRPKAAERFWWRKTKRQTIRDDQAQVFEFLIPGSVLPSGTASEGFILRFEANCDNLHAVMQSEYSFQTNQ